MRKYAIAGLMLVVLAAPAFAKTQYYVVKDTVGNCSVVDSKPGPKSGLKILGGGFSSKDDATKLLQKRAKSCAGVVG